MAKKNKYENYTKEELIDELETLKKKRYGLVWDRKNSQELIDAFVNWENVPENFTPNKFPVLKEVKNKEVSTDKNKPINLLIEGDNYHSLAVLNFTHKNKVDVIYIDPPYNTGGQDFIFNDKFVDVEDPYRHSKWLSFMEKRLRIAKNLLKKDGVIFISIDDNEMAQLKLLCDEIFEEKNYINTISIKAKVSAGASGGGEDRRLKKNIEYLLCYSGNSFERFDFIYKKTELMTYIKEMKDEGKSYKYTSVLIKEGAKKYFKTIKDGSGGEIKIFKHSDYKIKSINQIKRDEKLTDEEVYRKYFDTVMTTTNAQSSIRQRVWDATDKENNFYSIEYIPKTGRNKNKITDLFFIGKKKVLIIWLKDTAEILKNGKMFKKEKYGTFWDKISWNNVNKEGGVEFSNGKKPIELVKRILLLLQSRKDLIVLDFFAGSGSTGHAVLDLNNESKQNRKFILCTNNENDICVKKTYPRMINVIKGFNKRPGLGGNLKYLKTDFVGAQPTDRNKRDLVNNSAEMICIREDIFDLVIEENLDWKIYKKGKKYLGIVFNEEVIEDFKKAANKFKGQFIIYCFSYTETPPEKEFADLKNKHRLEPIPEIILKVYREIFKK